MRNINWANVLTWSRLVAVVPISILAVLGNRKWVFILYLLAIITDALDGPIARFQKMASSEGAYLDGTIDLILVAFSLWWLYLLTPEIYTQFMTYFLIVFFTFMLFFAVSYIRRKKILIPHLVLSKFSMLTFTLLLPIVLVWGIVPWYVHLTWITAFLARLEVIIFVFQDNEDMDARSVLFR